MNEAEKQKHIETLKSLAPLRTTDKKAQASRRNGTLAPAPPRKPDSEVKCTCGSTTDQHKRSCWKNRIAYQREHAQQRREKERMSPTVKPVPEPIPDGYLSITDAAARAGRSRQAIHIRRYKYPECFLIVNNRLYVHYDRIMASYEQPAKSV